MYRVRPSISRLSFPTGRPVGGQTQLRHATAVRDQRGRKGQVPYWTEEKLKTSSKYPLTVPLSKTIHPALEPTKKPRKAGAPIALSTIPVGVNVRTQIVSPRLCDDVLEYIGHTLEKHRGCDILDINPGSCLWSQKLHAFLQPRSHILLEPRPEKFASFIDPLLNAPDSKYRLVVKDPTNLSTYTEMIEEGVFPHQTRRDAFDGSAQEVNNTLLVTGSLAWDPRLPGLGFDSMAKQLFHHFASAAWKNNGFHSFGPVRSLFWVEHDDFRPLVAQSIAAMQKANRVLEFTHNLNVVVAAKHKERPVGRGSLGREPQHEIESVVRALRTGRQNGMELPAHRRENIHDFAAHVDEASNGTGISSVAFIHSYLREQDMAGKSAIGMIQEGLLNCYRYERDLINRYPDLSFNKDWILDNSRKPKQKTLEHPAQKELSVFSKMRSQFSKIIRTKLEHEQVADIGEKLYVAECEALNAEDGPEKEGLLKKVEELELAWQQAINNTEVHNRQLPHTEVDDRIALRYPPSPRLQWDKRPYEPLIVRSEEAWPLSRLGLISAEPIPRAADQNPEWYEWVQDFIFGLYNHPTESVKEALNRMQHGLSDIMDQCPSLKDPKKGGRMNMNQLRVRLLTNEMITELVAAYRAWPFKAPNSDHNKYFRFKAGPRGSSLNDDWI